MAAVAAAYSFLDIRTWRPKGFYTHDFLLLVMTTTTITLDVAVKRRLARLKFHPRESYTDVVRRLLKKPSLKQSDVDEIEAMLATAEILSDPETMRSLAKSMEDFKAGRLHSIDEV